MALSYAVVGTGAIGGYYGGRLAEAGCDVHFLLRSDYAQVRENGLIVESVKGDFALPNVQAYNNPADMPQIDVVLVCLKTTQNHSLSDLLPPLGANSAILLLQNGLNVEAVVEQVLQETYSSIPTLLGGLCFICANKIGPGHIRHIDYGRLLVGVYESAAAQSFLSGVGAADNATDGSADGGLKRLRAIASDFNRAKIATAITDDLTMSRWLKLVWNVPYNGLSVVLNATTEEMMADQPVRELIATLMREVVSVANAWGKENSRGRERALPENVVQQMLDQTETMPPYLTSMKLDFDQNKPLEIAAILGAPLQVAEAMRVEVPAMRMLHQQLLFLNARNVRYF